MLFISVVTEMSIAVSCAILCFLILQVYDLSSYMKK